MCLSIPLSSTKILICCPDCTSTANSYDNFGDECVHPCRLTKAQPLEPVFIDVSQQTLTHL